MIKAVMCIHEDEEILPFALASLVGHVDEIVAAIGPYKHYSNSLTTDGSATLIEQYGGNVYEGIWCSQVEKRNFLINKLNNGDWMYVIDSDEMLAPEGAYFLNRLNDYPHETWRVQQVSIRYPSDLYPGRHKCSECTEIQFKNNRLVKKNQSTHYWRSHYYLFHNQQNLWLTNNEHAPTSPISFIHIHFLRSTARKKDKWDYYLYRLNNKYLEEGNGFYSYWFYPNCWKSCRAFNPMGDDFRCNSHKDGLCHALPGRPDVTRGIKQIGPMILYK